MNVSRRYFARKLIFEKNEDVSRKGERRYAYRWGLKHFLWMNDRLPQGPWLQQDLGITLSTSVGMIGMLEIMLIVPTLRVGMPLRTLCVRS